MAAQSERLPNPASFLRKKRHSYARESYFKTVQIQDKKDASDKPFSLHKSWAAIRGSLSISLGIVVFFLCLALWVFIGYVLGQNFS